MPERDYPEHDYPECDFSEIDAAQGNISEGDEARPQLFGPEDADYQAFLAQKAASVHPERFELGKPHPDRAKQFKPFAALRGYEALVDQVIRDANEPHDFTALEESC